MITWNVILLWFKTIAFYVNNNFNDGFVYFNYLYWVSNRVGIPPYELELVAVRYTR